MKKFMILSIVAVLALSMGMVAFADGSEETPQWYNDMIEWRKEQVNEAVTNGEITEEDAKYWNEQIDEMEEHHNEYGFGPGMMGMYGRENGERSGQNNFGRGHCHRW